MGDVTGAGDAVRACALVPVKAFHLAKARLAPVLSPEERARLARWTAERVLAAAAPLPAHVVCDDPEVARWASDCGATVLWRPGVGLNAAVDHGLAELARARYTHAVVAHSDLPLARTLANVVRPERAVLVPDARRDGTNVMALPLHVRIHAAYGEGSFRRHLDALVREAAPVEVRFDPLLARDIDTPADLAHPLVQEVLPTWLRTTPASRR